MVVVRRLLLLLRLLLLPLLLLIRLVAIIMMRVVRKEKGSRERLDMQWLAGFALSFVVDVPVPLATPRAKFQDLKKKRSST
jgi:hypothetical protein